MALNITDNTEEVLQELEHKVSLALERVGLEAVGNAIDLAPVDTGNLRGSIEHTVDDRTVYIGTNVRYGPYVEFGTGRFSTEGGRMTPWVYQDDRGNWHYTEGQQPQPFIKPSVADYEQDYIEIIEDTFKG